MHMLFPWKFTGQEMVIPKSVYLKNTNYMKSVCVSLFKLNVLKNS